MGPTLLLTLAFQISGVALTRADDWIDFYIGTYTSPTGSQGIYHARLDDRTGAIEGPTLAVRASDPSYVALHPNGRFVYACQESSDGQYGAYEVQPDRTLKLINTGHVDGAGPCHVSVDRAGKHLFTASYGSGTFGCLTIRDDGSLGPHTALIRDAGSGPNKARQEGPHGHSAYADANSKYVYACDLGTDQVQIFKFDASTGAMTKNDPPCATMPGGSGPRHIAFHPSGKLLFVNNEMGNNVVSFKIDPSTGGLEKVQSISTLRAEDQGSNGTSAEIVCHPNGRYLYVSNRGEDSIAVFRVDAAGTLKVIQIEPAGVHIPRGFDIDPSGRWLIVAGQESNDLTSFKIDPRTGKLSPTGQKASLPHPVCIAICKR